MTEYKNATEPMTDERLEEIESLSDWVNCRAWPSHQVKALAFDAAVEIRRLRGLCEWHKTELRKVRRVYQNRITELRDRDRQIVADEREARERQ